MKIVKRTASIVASLIIILALGGFFFVRNFDLNRYKGEIESLVFQQTGRKLALNGEAKLGLSLIPTIVINDVTFANPDWAQNPYMAKLQKLEIQFSLNALLHRQIDIKKFSLINPEVYLEVAKDGRKSWEFSVNNSMVKQNSGTAPKVKDAKAAAAIGLIAKEVRLDNGKVIYFDAKNGKTIALNIKEIEFEAEKEQPMKLSAFVEYDKQMIEAKLALSDIQTILQQNKTDFDGVIKAFGIKTSLNGEAINLTGDINYHAEVDIHNPAGNFNVPETSLSARVDGDVNKADVNIRNLNIATNLITGMVKANWNKAKPEITADLRSDIFNVNSLSKNSMLSWNMPNLINEAAALEMVPDEKIPYEYLNQINGLFNVKIGKMILADDAVLMDIVANAKLNNGIFNINKLDATIFGGKIAMSGDINAVKKSMSAKIDATGINVNSLYKAAKNNDGLQVLSGGLLDVNADLTASGATYRKLSETLNGRFTALVDKSKIKTGKLDWMTNSVWSELFKLLKVDAAKNTELDIECAVVNGQFKSGQALFDKGIALSSDKLKLVGSGDINLVNDKINFMISPMLNKLAQGNITQALASFIRIKGKIQKPSIGIDTASAVSTVVGSVATGGLYLGSEVLMSGDENLCNTALQGSKYVSRFPRKESVQNTAKDAYQNVTGNAKDALREIGSTAKGMFNSLKNNLKNKEESKTE